MVVWYSGPGQYNNHSNGLEGEEGEGEEGPDYEGFCRQIVKTMSDSLEQRQFRTVSLYQVSVSEM